MNVELKRIAEKKLEQLGGDVCGVLVRKDGKLAAVDEHGRVQWLQGGQGAEPVAWMNPSNPNEVISYKKKTEIQRCYNLGIGKSAERYSTPLYTRPPSAGVAESIEVAIDMLEDYARALDSGDLDGPGHSTTSCIHEVIDELATALQPPKEGE